MKQLLKQRQSLGKLGEENATSTNPDEVKT